MEQKKIIIPEGWEIDKVQGNVITLKESKKKLPKTWKECIKNLNRTCYVEGVVPSEVGKPLLAFMQLLVCREIYRQGWKPDWKDYETPKYCIYPSEDRITTLSNQRTSRMLSFETREIAENFLENFHDLIEEAKELI